MLLFIAPVSTDEKDKNASDSVDMDMMSPTSVYVAAKEVEYLAPGDSIDIDVDDIVFPGPLPQAASGSYRVQAVLDVHHTYNYEGRAAGDLLSVPVTVSVPLDDSANNALILTQVFPGSARPSGATYRRGGGTQTAGLRQPCSHDLLGTKHSHARLGVASARICHSSPAKVSNRLFTMVSEARYRIACPLAPVLYDRMKQGRMPELIWVLLDESSPTGTHEFADSVNNGPWGTALTTS